MADNVTTNLSELNSSTQKVIKANAEAQGITPEAYLQSRGGVNPVTGRYGDSATPFELSNEEYLAARKAGGGQGINAATAKKNYEYLISQGYTPDQAATNSGWSPSGGYTGGPSSTTGGGGKTTSLTDYYASTAANDKATVAANQARSAYALIKQEFEARGLGALIPELQTIMQKGLTDANEIRLYLQGTQAYKNRFAANQERIKNGLTALTPAQYTNLEDQYQEIMRRSGLPSKYYSRNDLGVQEGFNKLIANNVAPTEVEDRIMTAQNRLYNADPYTMDAMSRFFPNITKGDLLAYTLDPENTIGDIKRKVTAAEIGGAALAENLLTDKGTAEELAKYGVTKAQAQQGYQTIAGILPGSQKLADIYAAQNLGPYTQATAEQEIFGTAGAAEAARKRKKLAELQQASFSGSAGTSQSALSRDRTISPYMVGQPGAGQF